MSTLTNLIAYWRMDEGSGADRRDSVGAFDLTQSGGAVNSTTGKIGSAAIMNLAGRSLVATTNEPADFSGAALSVAGWIRIGTLPTSGENELLTLNMWDGVDQYRSMTLYIDGSDDHLILKTQDDNVASSSTIKATTFGALSAATWYHVVLTWTPATQFIYVNNTGDSVSAEDFTGCLTINSFPVGSGLDASWGVAFDEWGIWDEVISATDRSDLYNSGSGAVPPGLGYPGGGQVAFFGFH